MNHVVFKLGNIQFFILLKDDRLTPGDDVLARLTVKNAVSFL